MFRLRTFLTGLSKNDDKNGAEILEYIVVLAAVAILITTIWPDFFDALKDALLSVPDTFSGNDTIYIE